MDTLSFCWGRLLHDGPDHSENFMFFNRSLLGARISRWYTDPMYFLGNAHIFRVCSVGLVVSLLFPTLLFAFERGVFRAFTEHISRQITKDVYDFSEAQTCTEWFYRKLRKPPYVKPDVERTSMQAAEGGADEHPCAIRYPKGIDSARERFSETQSSLSLSLTFYQFALIADKNDDENYDPGELEDVLKSVGMVYRVNDHPLLQLKQKFDSVRQASQFEVLTDGMQELFQKGYRLTEFDQGQMDRITGAGPK